MDAMRPNLNAIFRLIESWSVGVSTNDETFERLERLMSPEYYIPVSQLVPIGDVKVENQSDEILRIVQRVEIRLTALTNHLNMPLPDELNPQVLFEDVRELADAGNKIRAIYVHRRRTGCGLVQAKQVIDDYLRNRQI